MPTNIQSTFCLLILFSGGLDACTPRKEPVTATLAATKAPAPVAAAVAPATAPPTVAPLTASGAPQFDPADVAASQVRLPPFPYLEWPRELPLSQRKKEVVDFDAAWVLAGAHLRTVEGRVEKRQFYNEDAKLSALAVRRNYWAAIKALGGVKINTIKPDDPALVKENEENFADIKLGMRGPQFSYEAYLIRSADKNIWITFMVDDSRTFLRIIEEKEMEQSVDIVTADTIPTKLAK